jgi:hypothetical protein
MYSYYQGGGARHAFSLAWLVAEGILSEGGLARLMGSWYKKEYTNLQFN